MDLQALVAAALAEVLGTAGDVTSHVTVPDGGLLRISLEQQ